MKKEVVDAMGWAFLGKFAGKYTRRGLLPAGEDVPIELEITGRIKQTSWQQNIAGRLCIGHDLTRSKSSAPDTVHLVAVILSKLSSRNREQLLRCLPEEFARNKQQLPEVDPLSIEAAKSMLERLRANTEQAVKGSVSVVQIEVKAEG